MASVPSLDQDMRRLRLDRYTPQAANEVRSWIENTLGEKLDAGDLLDALKDGVALCKLANLILPPPGIKFKASSMPFTQRENISHFLTACERDPLNLPAHDRFLTVDLYDNKDPAQVIQCIGAFSRAANAANPSRFPSAIGPRRPASPTRRSPARAPAVGESNGGIRERALSNASKGSESTPDGKRALSPALTDASSASRSTAAVSSWSKKSDEAVSAPAWNIHQYGYMGGASQGNQGISFGARRQITSASPSVPSLAEKEKRRKEEEAEADRRRLEAERADRERRAEFEERERKERIAEEERWEEETRKARERERQQIEEERRRWEEEERQWKEEEERRRRDEEANALPQSALRGQYLSQYQSEQRKTSSEDPQNDRIKELERQLEEAKERERRYQLEREQRNDQTKTPERTPEPPENSNTYRRPRSLSPKKNDQSRSRPDSWEADDGEQLHRDLASHQADSTSSPSGSSIAPSRPLPDPSTASTSQGAPQIAQRTSQPLEPPFAEPQPAPPPSASAEPPVVKASAPEATTPTPSRNPLPRPLPEPTKSPVVPYTSPGGLPPAPFSRTDRFLSHNPAPTPQTPKSHFPAEMGLTSSAERAAEDARRVASQSKTKAGGWASKSLLEREMERERERQREWEEAQMAKPGGSGKVMGPRELKR